MTRLASGILTIVVALGAIAAATLGDGDPLALEPTGHLCLVCGSAGGVDVVLNLLLFVPLGVGLWLAGVRGRWAVALGLLVSAGVELTQLVAFVGRAPTLSDLLTNTTGTAAGWAVAATWRRWLHPPPPLARRLAVGAWLVWLAVLAATAVGLQWSLADGARVNALPPDDAFVRPFEGAMREWSLAGSSDGASEAWAVVRGTDAPRVGAAPTDSVTAARLPRILAAERLELRASAHAMLPPGKLRPLVIVHDDAWRSLLVLGQQRRGLLLRVRTRSSDLRFRSPELVLPDAFPARIPSGDDPRRGPVVDVHGLVTEGALVVRAGSAEAERSLRMPRSPFLGWTMLAPQGIHYDHRGPLLTALWIVALVAPLAYWVSRAAPGRARGVALGAVAAVLPVVVTARTAGLSLAGAGEWSAMCIAILLGALLASLLQRSASPHGILARASLARQYIPS